MEFMEVYEKPELLEEASFLYLKPVVVLAQPDVWVVHVYAIAMDGDDFLVEMFDASKPSKVTLPSDEELGDAMQDGADDTQTCHSLKSALALVLDGARFHGNPELTALAKEIRDGERAEAAANVW